MLKLKKKRGSIASSLEGRVCLKVGGHWGNQSGRQYGITEWDELVSTVVQGWNIQATFIPVSILGFQTYLQELENTWIGISSRQLYSLDYYEKGEGKQEIMTPASALKHFCGQNCWWNPGYFWCLVKRRLLVKDKNQKYALKNFILEVIVIITSFPTTLSSL